MGEAIRIGSTPTLNSELLLRVAVAVSDKRYEAERSQLMRCAVYVQCTCNADEGSPQNGGTRGRHEPNVTLSCGGSYQISLLTFVSILVFGGKGS